MVLTKIDNIDLYTVVLCEGGNEIFLPVAAVLFLCYFPGYLSVVDRKHKETTTEGCSSFVNV